MMTLLVRRIGRLTRERLKVSAGGPPLRPRANILAPVTGVAAGAGACACAAAAMVSTRRWFGGMATRRRALVLLHQGREPSLDAGAARPPDGSRAAPPVSRLAAELERGASQASAATRFSSARASTAERPERAGRRFRARVRQQGDRGRRARRRRRRGVGHSNVAFQAGHGCVISGIVSVDGELEGRTGSTRRRVRRVFLNAHQVANDGVGDADTCRTLANAFPYSSTSSERHIVSAMPPPNGASVAMPSNIGSSAWARKNASNSLAGAAELLRAYGAFRRGRCDLRRLAGPRHRDAVASAVGHHITSISACSAPAALIACRMAIMSRGPTPSALRPSTSSCRLTPEAARRSCFVLVVDLDVGARDDRGRAVRERRRAANLRRLGDADRQVALGDGDGADPHVLAHDDDAGLLVDDDAGDLVGLDRSCSMSVSRLTMAALYAGRIAAPRSRVASACAVPVPRTRLIASAMRRAVVKSGLRSARRSALRAWPG